MSVGTVRGSGAVKTMNWQSSEQYHFFHSYDKTHAISLNPLSRPRLTVLGTNVKSIYINLKSMVIILYFIVIKTL